MTTGPSDVVPASSVDVLPLCTRQRLSDVLSLSHALVDFPHGRHLRLPKKYTLPVDHHSHFGNPQLSNKVVGFTHGWWVGWWVSHKPTTHPPIAFYYSTVPFTLMYHFWVVGMVGLEAIF